jgi:hypothetical protein
MAERQNRRLGYCKACDGGDIAQLIVGEIKRGELPDLPAANPDAVPELN